MSKTKEIITVFTVHAEAVAAYRAAIGSGNKAMLSPAPDKKWVLVEYKK